MKCHYRIILDKILVVRQIRARDGITFTGWSDAPPIHYDKNERFVIKHTDELETSNYIGRQICE
jgi:hypothetical protein